MLQLHWSLPLGLLITGISACHWSASLRAEEANRSDGSAAPLHQRIDQLVEAAAIGPLSPRCSDPDFLRRIALDLTGAIPTPAQVREFLADTSPGKRERIIDELLDSPEFARHMAVQLDVLLLERQTDKYITVKQWEGYLIGAVADGKPLDQLFRELIAADRIDPEARAALKFVLNRDAEPNAVTRDIGRLAFGMDLQCAQCHDHPLVDDYYQEDYYGLFAFVHRTSLFTDPKSKQVGLSEKADGEVSFTSVFTGDGRDRARPQLPKGSRLFGEPKFGEGEQYATAPEKGVAGVPKVSRREALAEMLSESRHFQRNVANRLWAHMFGRGIVHPVDFHHSANPPINPPLLDLLADELVAGGFELRGLLRELALTNAYQRVCDAPRPETVNFADIAARGDQLSRDQDAASAAIDPLKEDLAQAEAALNDALEQNRALAAQLPDLESAAREAKQALEKAHAAEKSAVERLAHAKEQSRTLAAALAPIQEAVAKLPDDQQLADAAAVIGAKADELTTAVEVAKANADEKTERREAAGRSVAESEAALAETRAAQAGPEKLAELEDAQLRAARQLNAADDARRAIASRLELCRTAGQYASLANMDPATAETAWQSLVEQWTIGGQIAALRPLTPEQMALSAMRATGMLAPQIAAVEAKLDESPPEALKTASDGERPRMRSRLVQQELLEQTRGTVDQFVTHYGGLPGEDFQATANQALFFGNSSLVEGWLRPEGENLASRLAGLEDPAALADELYISVLSRPAKESERQEIAELLSDSAEQRTQSIAQLIWALLSSTEFRFNH